MMDREKLLNRMLDKLYDELEPYYNMEFKNGNCLDAVDKISHSIKSISTVLAMEGYGNGSSGNRGGGMYSYHPYGNYDGSHSGGMNGYYNNRSRGADEEYIRMLMEIKNMAPDEHTAKEIQRMIDERR